MTLRRFIPFVSRRFSTDFELQQVNLTILFCLRLISYQAISFYLTCEKTLRVLWATIRPDFTGHFIFRFCIKTTKFRQCVRLDLLNYFSLWTTADCELWWFANFELLFNSFNQSDYLNLSNKDSNWLIVACFMRIESLLTTLLFALEIKYCMENWSNAWGISQTLYYKTSREA